MSINYCVVVPAIIVNYSAGHYDRNKKYSFLGNFFINKYCPTIQTQLAFFGSKVVAEWTRCWKADAQPSQSV